MPYGPPMWKKQTFDIDFRPVPPVRCVHNELIELVNQRHIVEAPIRLYIRNWASCIPKNLARCKARFTFFSLLRSFFGIDTAGQYDRRPVTAPEACSLSNDCMVVGGGHPQLWNLFDIGKAAGGPPKKKRLLFHYSDVTESRCLKCAQKHATVYAVFVQCTYACYTY